jgi:molybdopterin-binding protein
MLKNLKGWRMQQHHFQISLNTSQKQNSRHLKSHGKVAEVVDTLAEAEVAVDNGTTTEVVGVTTTITVETVETKDKEETLDHNTAEMDNLVNREVLIVPQLAAATKVMAKHTPVNMHPRHNPSLFLIQLSHRNNNSRRIA